MANKELLFQPDLGDKAISDTNGDVVLYIEDIKIEAITHIVEMWNENKTVKEIQHWLDKEAKGVTLDESGYIVEQLEAWCKLSGDTAEVKKTDANYADVPDSKL